MALERLSCEGERPFVATGPGDVTLEDLVILIDPAPQAHHPANQLHLHLVEVPAPLPQTAHLAHPLSPDVAGEQRPEPVPPVPHSLVAQVVPGFEQQARVTPQRPRKLNVHHHHQTDDLGR